MYTIVIIWWKQKHITLNEYYSYYLEKTEIYILTRYCSRYLVNKASEFDQEITQTHIADQPKALWRRTTEQYQSVDTGKTNKLKQPDLYSHQDDCKTRKDTKQFTTKHGTNTDPNN